MELEERYNCYFNFTVTGTTFQDEAFAILMAGDKYADFVAPATFSAGYWYSSNNVIDLKTVDYLDFDQPWWYQDITYATEWNGKQYGMKGAFNNPIPDSWVIYFNKDLAEELQLPDLYQLVRDGQWTLDKFQEYARKATRDTNGDNLMDDRDCFGWGHPHLEGDTAFWVGAGGEYFSKGEDGYWTLSTATTRNRNLMEKLVEMLVTDKTYYDRSGGEGWMYYYTDMFPAGQMLFAPTPVYAVSRNNWGWWEMETDFGILPMPKYDENQEYYYATVDHFTSMLMIPVNTNNEDNIGLILEALTREFYERVVPAAYENIEINCRDEESLEMIKLSQQHFRNDPVSDQLAYTLNGAVYGGGVNVLLGCITAGGDFSALYEAEAQASQLALDEFQGRPLN